jgi:butyryl-CoA dehydrogenase
VNTFLSPAQQAVKDLYQAYARDHVAPVARQLEEGAACTKEFLQKLGQAGYLGITVGKEYGGQGGDFLQAALFAEAVAQYQPALALAIAEHIAAIELIEKFGTETQKSRFLPLLARGECLATTAFAEKTAGTDFKAIQSTIDKDKLSGSKTSVVNAKHASLCVASAQDSSSNKLTLVLADISIEAGTMEFGAEQKMLGMHAITFQDLTFKSHKLSGDALLPATEDGSEMIMFARDVAKTIVAAAALGMLEMALQASVDHANSREQFGQKIGQFQAVQWKLADMSVEGSAARMLVYRAAWSKDEDPASFRKEAAMCKWYATRAARTHSSEAVQILGAYGLSADSPVEHIYRDAKFLEIAEGTSEYQKVILADQLGV